MLSFRFHDLTAFQGKSAAIKRPREITEFSFDDEHAHHLDNRSLRYYYPPFIQVPYVSETRRLDLSQGFDTFVKYDDSISLGLNPLLDTVQHHEEQTRTKLNADILTWRGMMTKVRMHHLREPTSTTKTNQRLADPDCPVRHVWRIRDECNLFSGAQDWNTRSEMIAANSNAGYHVRDDQALFRAGSLT